MKVDDPGKLGKAWERGRPECFFNIVCLSAFQGVTRYFLISSVIYFFLIALS